MLEYFTYKKVKKHQAEKHAAEGKAQTPLLDEADENFLERMISAEGTPPPLPERPRSAEVGDGTTGKNQAVLHDGKQALAAEENRHPKDKGKDKTNEKSEKKANRLSFLQRTFTKKGRGATANPKIVTPAEAANEEDDINKVLDELNLAAINNRAFSLSKESQELVQKFTLILKDLVNGAPTAYDDLTHLLDHQNKTLESKYESLPSFLQKLITQLPTKLTSTLAPELLAVASEAGALASSDAAAASAAGGAAGLAGAAKSFIKVASLKDLVAKPGAVVSLLKAIMNALKLRWPAFMGTNVLLSLGLFVLLFVFWYCHKRGRETRLLREKAEQTVDSNGRIVELEDDPMIEAGPGRRHSGQGGHSSGRDHDDRDDRSERRSRDDRREHRHSSSRDDHLRVDDNTTPSRSQSGRRSSRRSSDRPRSADRPRSSENEPSSGRR